ncbi:NAD+ synthase [Phenylobacterium sp.]|uniref:NAD+ synthase n=1 Tax=Phenylobacterium sp. TaxID=1871053 RepID=UPI002B8DB503|nr:NAD+ synthase [Phenylobacterium sp.]HLZ74798.1 NAD+ synthase [Phenylobacterium sp.]
MPSTDRLKISLAQLNPTVGDIAGNAAKLRAALATAREQGADLLVTPELFLAGYPAEDLVLRQDFLDAVEQAVEALKPATASGTALLLGAPWRHEGRVHNAALLLDRGELRVMRFKHELPNYGVFDEKRVFAAGPPPGPIAFRGVRLGVMICEDMWTPDVTETLEESGAQMLIVLNGSPFEADKQDERVQLAVQRVQESGLALLYVNQVGGQDELVFDGGSFALDRQCRLRLQAPSWQEALVPTEWRFDDDERWVIEPGLMSRPEEGLAATYQAMVLGLRDYVSKNGFPGVALGMSGGIDSALSAAVAVDALGADRVRCVMMPYRYTSAESREDAAAAAELLGAELTTIDIAPAVDAFGTMLVPAFVGRNGDITEENLQARARGVTLMALSNKFGWMVLSTGNKSEMSVGYATLYGDMCGGYAVLKDIYKTSVFALARWRNDHKPAGALGPDGPVMPARIITKPPTAELKPDQKDQDTLPPYDVLDDILAALIEREMPVDAIVARGHAPETVMRVWRMLDRAEYKRRQAPPGVKTTRRAFGRDRRYPITNSFQGG